MVDHDTIGSIEAFKDALLRPPDGSDDEEEFIGSATTNRGNKLKRDARQVAHGKLMAPPFEGHGVKVVEYLGHKRAVIYKRRRVVRYGDGEERAEDDEDDERDEHSDDDEFGSEAEENPYDEVKLDDLLAPIERPSQVPFHPSLSRTFTSSTLKTMAMRTLEVIIDEQKHAVQLAKLMSVFLGDDPSYLLSEKLNVPWASPEDEEDKTENGGEQQVAAPQAAKSEEISDDPNATRRITRNQAVQEVDPFFAMPQIAIDRDSEIAADHAEETRQLTQIAQQRMEEFIRCMVSVRSGLIRADRLRDRVFRWCKEMNGDDELDDAIANDPATGKPPGSVPPVPKAS